MPAAGGTRTTTRVRLRRCRDYVRGAAAFFERDRHAEVEALPEAAAQLEQGVKLLGRLDALGNHDTNTLQAVLLLSALMVLVGNLVADLMYAWADPRIRYD